MRLKSMITIKSNKFHALSGPEVVVERNNPVPLTASAPSYNCERAELKIKVCSHEQRRHFQLFRVAFFDFAETTMQGNLGNIPK
jgi:hypothetical protein